MSDMILTISGKGGKSKRSINPDGMTIGRSPRCQLVLEDTSVSKTHALLYRDPLGRWLVRDMGSHNGVWVGSTRVADHALTPGESFRVGPYSLAIVEEAPHELDADTAASQSTDFFPDSYDTTILEREESPPELLTTARTQQLNALAGRLAEVTDSVELYQQLCSEMAAPDQADALVLTLSQDDNTSVVTPRIIAKATSSVGRTSDRFHLSRRVLNAIRFGAAAVLASNAPATSADMELTVDSSQRSRTVACSEILATSGHREVLYVEIPSERAGSDLRDYVQAAARLTGLLRRNLSLQEQKTSFITLQNELLRARSIQQSLMPAPPEGLDIAWHYAPADHLSGDFCDFWTATDGRLVLSVGDVCGHGLTAAMVMATIHASFRANLSASGSLVESMCCINDYLTRFSNGKFASIVLARYDPSTGRVTAVQDNRGIVDRRAFRG